MKDLFVEFFYWKIRSFQPGVDIVEFEGEKEHNDVSSFFVKV